MFWILRRTGAANFFNSLNNNCSSSKGGNNSTQDKYVKRPPRKAYGRLSADSDDAASMKHTKIDDPFDDLDNFEIITPDNGRTNGNARDGAPLTTALNGGCQHIEKQDAAGGVGAGGAGQCGAAGSGGLKGDINGFAACTATDCQGNFVSSEMCDLGMAGLCHGAASDVVFKLSANAQRQKEVNENTINRLQAMAMSDDDDYDESLTCNVCDRAFHCHRQLASHQQKKRHFGCSGCDSLFPSLMLLEHHKEEFEHWSDDEISRRICCRRSRGDDYFTDTDSFTSEAESEDLERLL